MYDHLTFIRMLPARTSPYIDVNVTFVATPPSWRRSVRVVAMDHITNVKTTPPAIKR